MYCTRFSDAFMRPIAVAHRVVVVCHVEVAVGLVLWLAGKLSVVSVDQSSEEAAVHQGQAEKLR